MNNITLLFIFVVSSVCLYSQNDTGMVLSKTESIVLINKINILKNTVSIQDSIIKLHDLNAVDYRKSIVLKDSIISNQDKQIENFSKNQIDYQKIVQELQPKWYEDKFLWMGLGIVVGVLVTGF